VKNRGDAETYKAQIFKLLDADKTEIRFNSEWMTTNLARMVFVRLASHITVKQILERDDFAKRLEQEVLLPCTSCFTPHPGLRLVALEADVELEDGSKIQPANGRGLAARVRAGVADSRDHAFVGRDRRRSEDVQSLGITSASRTSAGNFWQGYVDIGRVDVAYYELLTDLTPAAINRMRLDVALSHLTLGRQRWISPKDHH